MTDATGRSFLSYRRSRLGETRLLVEGQLREMAAREQSLREELDALESALFARIDRKILSLADNSRPSGCKKLRGYRDLWRIRVGDYRVVYLVDDAKALATIVRVAHRKEVYES